MKKVLIATTVVLATLLLSSCQSQPQKMYEKVKMAAQLAGEGKIEESDQIWSEIQAWSRSASEADRLEFQQLALGDNEVKE